MPVPPGAWEKTGGAAKQKTPEAAEAFRPGHEKQDYILMARARIAQATSELARVEEQLGDDAEIARHAYVAVEYADQAITLALGTQNKRLLAEAYIARGFIAAFDFFAEWEVASDLAKKAVKLLSPGDRDHLYKSFNDLTRVLTRVSSLAERLKLWSLGQVTANDWRGAPSAITNTPPGSMSPRHPTDQRKMAKSCLFSESRRIVSLSGT